jgi:hypothetical protein
MLYEAYLQRHTTGALAVCTWHTFLGNFLRHFCVIWYMFELFFLRCIVEDIGTSGGCIVVRV